MTDNVRKIFDLLGVEPNEIFKIEDRNGFWKIDEELNLYYRQGHYDNGDYAYNSFNKSLIIDLIKKTEHIIKLPKEPKKKKLRDLTVEEYKKWFDKNCSSDLDCKDCIFNNVMCPMDNQCWVNNKELYSDSFLNQEIEVE